MIRIIIILAYLTILFSACNSNSNEAANTNKLTMGELMAAHARQTYFREFLKKFKHQSLPFTYRDIYLKDDFPYTNLSDFDEISDDTLFFKYDFGYPSKCFAIVGDTSKYITLMYFYFSEGYAPELATYDKKGNLISSAGLLVNGCGGDCDLAYCSSTVTIKKDYSIFSADTFKWKAFCDENGPIPNTSVMEVNSKTGKIDKSGKITMSIDFHEELEYTPEETIIEADSTSID